MVRRRERAHCAPVPTAAARPDPALVVILAGIGAALHVGKLPPAIPVLQAELGLSLVQAGFLLSLVQLAGMTLGAAFGLVADGLGPRRSMVGGLALLALASAVGALATGAPALMALRAVEGFGFLLVVLPAPGLVRRLVAPARLPGMLGLWGAYMPVATAAALLLGPLAIGAVGWRGWWGALAAVSAALVLAVLAGVPRDGGAAAAPSLAGWAARLRGTLAARSPWLLAASFAVYSGQWLAVVGFLPAIYQQAGIGGAAVGALTALAAGVNALGNLGGGALLQRGLAAPRLLAAGYLAMALGAAIAFAPLGLPAALRYAAVLAFSMAGGMVPATLFSLAVRMAPGEDRIATTVGWMQQLSSLGQFAGPPLVAWVASRAGGWHWTWLVTGACSAAGLLLARAIGAELEKKRYAAIPR